MRRILPIIASIFIFTGCSTSTETTTKNNKSQDNINETNIEARIQDSEQVPKEGGTLTLDMRLPKTLNPLMNEDYTVDNILKLIFEPLFTINQNLKPIPNLASNYSISEDGKLITINMRDGLKWHNGTNISAQDVVFSLDVIKSNQNSIYAKVLDKVYSYSSKDNKVFIQYIEPYAWNIYNLCFPIIPKNYYEKNLAIDSKASFEPVGSGSYKFSSYRLANSLSLEKTDGIKTKPYIDNINVLIMPDRATDLNAFEQNITSSLKVSFSEWGKLNFNKEKTSTKFITNKYEFLGFNHNINLYKNLYFRKAIAYMLPKDEILQNIMLESGVSSLTPINPDSWNSSATEIERYEYSIEKAIENLALASLNSTEVQTTILVNSENEQRLEIAELISKRLEQIGIKADVVAKPFGEYLKDLESGNYQMFLGGIDFNIVPNFKSFLTEDGMGEGGINYFKYQDPKMKLLIENMYKAIGEESFIKASKEFEKYFSEQLPLVGLYFKNDILLTDGNILGLKTPSVYNQYNGMDMWYIKQEDVVKND